MDNRENGITWFILWKYIRNIKKEEGHGTSEGMDAMPMPQN